MQSSSSYTVLTGGLGFIGSTTAVELSQAGIPIIIIDNLKNSNINVLNNIKLLSNNEIIFYHADILDTETMNDIFNNHQINWVIHFAAYKSVSQSIQEPLLYYHNNINGLIAIVNLCLQYKVEHFIFSSSATVYGNAPIPFTESSTVGIGITCPYGQTKYMGETILKDICKSNPQFNCTCLRYFNPVGAHSSGLIGENPNGIPNNLMPYIIRVAINYHNNSNSQVEYNSLSIFGNNYNTDDGTCVRDFIHVVDLAKAHLCAMNTKPNGFNVYNVGTGKGTSVLELVTIFQKMTKIYFPIEIKERREGDRDVTFCNVNKIYNELGWKSKLTLENMCLDSWNYIQNSIK
tara:strand:- start:16499 stop:17539 length:1041 start_codon:yes stop_codon:yes gene_type:complete